MWLQVLSLLCVLFFTRWTWRRWRYDLHKIPSPPSVPILGHTLDFLFGQAGKQLVKYLRRSLEQLNNPGMMRLELMGRSWLIVRDIDFIRSVMLSKTSPFPKDVDMLNLLSPSLGHSPEARLSIAEPLPTPYVKAVRKIYVTAFQASNLKKSLPKLHGVIHNLIDIIESNRQHGAIDCQELFVRMTLDTIGQVGFDCNLGGLDGSRKVYKLLLGTGYIGRKRFNNPLKTMLRRFFPNSEEERHDRDTIKKMNGEWSKIVDDIEKRNAPEDGEEAFWYGFKTLKHPETNKPIERQTMIAEVATAVVGGMDTTGHQLGWIFSLLATHPHVVQKLLTELTDHGLYGDDSRDLQYEDLSKLTYLAATVKEGMRLTHIIPVLLSRIVPRDMTILGYKVPRGTTITCPGDQGFNIREIWNDPDVFRPERWLEGEDVSHKYCMPFSVGPRDCPGQRLAITQMRVVILELVKRFTFTLEGGTFEDLMSHAKDGLLIESSKGVWIRFETRAN